jgi:predicted peptidase
MKKITITLLSLFSLLGNDGLAQTKNVQVGYKDWFIGNFRSGVYVPASYQHLKQHPLVIYLHGKSDTVTRDNLWYHLPSQLNDPAIVLTPKCPLSETGEWGNSWSDGDPPMIVKTFQLIDSIKKYYAIDEDRIYIYGISMGAIGTFGLVKKHTYLFAAGYAICGWGDTSAAPQLARIPFWIFHGEDDDVVPVQGSRGIYNAVLKHGGKNIQYTEFKKVKHDAWNHVDNDAIIRWILKQRKNGASAKAVTSKT